jgi:predicted GIY-YIG superfamily endonuclease
VGTLYLLHFSRPYHHAKHYLGYTKYADVRRRVADHQKGRGANLTRHAVQSGIELYLAWSASGERVEERRLKRYSHVNRWCPLCKGRCNA